MQDVIITFIAGAEDRIKKYLSARPHAKVVYTTSFDKSYNEEHVDDDKRRYAIYKKETMLMLIFDTGE